MPGYWVSLSAVAYVKRDRTIAEGICCVAALRLQVDGCHSPIDSLVMDLHFSHIVRSLGREFLPLHDWFVLLSILSIHTFSAHGTSCRRRYRQHSRFLNLPNTRRCGPYHSSCKHSADSISALFPSSSCKFHMSSSRRRMGSLRPCLGVCSMGYPMILAGRVGARSSCHLDQDRPC